MDMLEVEARRFEAACDMVARIVVAEMESGNGTERQEREWVDSLVKRALENKEEIPA